MVTRGVQERVYIFADMSTNLYTCLRFVCLLFTNSFTSRQICTHLITMPWIQICHHCIQKLDYVIGEEGWIAERGMLFFDLLCHENSQDSSETDVRWSFLYDNEDRKNTQSLLSNNQRGIFTKKMKFMIRMVRIYLRKSTNYSKEKMMKLWLK